MLEYAWRWGREGEGSTAKNEVSLPHSVRNIKTRRVFIFLRRRRRRLLRITLALVLTSPRWATSCHVLPLKPCPGAGESPVLNNPATLHPALSRLALPFLYPALILFLHFHALLCSNPKVAKFIFSYGVGCTKSYVLGM